MTTYGYRNDNLCFKSYMKHRPRFAFRRREQLWCSIIPSLARFYFA